MTHAIVKNPDGTTYVSPLFALRFEGLSSLAVGLDESLTQVCLLKHWHRDPQTHLVTRGLFLLSNEYGESSAAWVGAEWFLRDEALFCRIMDGERIPVADDPCFAPYARPITLPDWFEIQTQNDAASLNSVSFDFHDATLDAFNEEGEDWIIRFDTSWECFITVKFCGVTEESFKEKVGLILNSHIEKITDGCTFTVLNGYGGRVGGVEFDREVENAFIKCKKIFWKIEIEL
ncbi:MAG: hypothetical protein E7645_03465 [Ruminococcaceae bacterium]|nr:hypothetical protein [Oscillospiraceae bacterium]